MQINTRQYDINGQLIEWGKPFNEVVPLLNNFSKFKPYGGKPNIRCKGTEIFGLKSTEAEVRAPFEDKPVMQVIYQLSPNPPGFFEKLHSPYLKQLVKVLGKPYKEKSNYNPSGYSKEYLSGAVVFSAKWLIDDIRISLSVYGGTRNEDSGPAAAGIFINWVDEKKAAKPYRERLKLFEDTLSNNLNDNTQLKKFTFQYNLQPYRDVNYDLKDPYIAEKDNELRVSQLALYKKELFQTPKFIQDRIKENEVALYSVPELSKTFFSNKWDTVFLSPNEENSIIYYEVLPARGSGGRELEIKEIQMYDSKESDILLQILNAIEKETGIKALKKQKYDD